MEPNGRSAKILKADGYCTVGTVLIKYCGVWYSIFYAQKDFLWQLCACDAHINEIPYFTHKKDPVQSYSLGKLTRY